MKITNITLVALLGLILVSQPASAAVIAAKNTVAESLSQVYSTPLTRTVTNTRTNLKENQTDGYVYKTVDSSTGVTCYVYVGAATTATGGISCVK